MSAVFVMWGGRNYLWCASKEVLVHAAKHPMDHHGPGLLEALRDQSADIRIPTDPTLLITREYAMVREKARQCPEAPEEVLEWIRDNL